MKYIYFTLIMLIILLIGLVACSDNNDVIIKKVESAEEAKDPVLIEEVDEKDEEVDQFIEFFLEDEQLTIHLNRVPILDYYLQGAENRDEAIKNMNMQHLPIEDRLIYLLEFACMNERCSYIIFNHDDESNAAILLADVARFSNYYVSPNNQNIIFQFIRESQNVPLSHLVSIDLIDWRVVSLIMPESDDTIIEYTRPIIGIDWINDQEINVISPKLDEITDQSYRSWDESEEKKHENHTMIISKNIND
ncbi:hypothetical protein ACFQ4N_10320 [Oceanobacillus iheyensis]|uniref:Lipoprotein n=1 Tax=Oceanobacillus iheyensis (strain DSM 14371 / CIP 107618 / JCM 11309 / KCTC 3954 / HTE831) TaxID=221109 RepID=Q8ERC0_OCEIH|nr:hypothetical protein [Oceanobacillus iheyensis]BAC13342.1 hypothetical protein [Oceanobacillus iheyensis HTE831]